MVCSCIDFTLGPFLWDIVIILEARLVTKNAKKHGRTCRRMLLRCPLGMGFWKHASVFIPDFHIYYHISSTMLIRYHWRRWIARKASFGSSCGLKLFPFVAVFLWLSTQFLVPQSAFLEASQSVYIGWSCKFARWAVEWLLWYLYWQVGFWW